MTLTDRLTPTCAHDISEQDVAVQADGMCPLCQAAKMERLREALVKLSNEVLGSLPLMEQLARREFGNTNYAILLQRAEEARALAQASD